MRVRISDVAQQGFRVQFHWRGGVDKLECDEDKAETVFLCFGSIWLHVFNVYLSV